MMVIKVRDGQATSRCGLPKDGGGGGCKSRTTYPNKLEMICLVVNEVCAVDRGER